MPPVPVPNSDYFLAQLKQMRWQMQQLQVQQQSIISNLQGQPVVAFGLQPGSDPAEYGIGLLNKDYGSLLSFFGEDAAGNVGLYYYNGSGTKISQYDETGLHFYKAGVEVVRIDEDGVHVYDASSNNRVNAGELSNGDYGLQVIDVAGNSEEILPAVEEYVDGQINVTSTSYVSDGGPSVTATVGASGKVLVSASSWISVNPTANNDNGGLLGLYQDGTFVRDLLELDAGVSGVEYQGFGTANTATIRVLSGLSAGSHTWELRYRVKDTVGCTFAARSLVITPI